LIAEQSCPACGKQAPLDARACPACGFALAELSEFDDSAAMSQSGEMAAVDDPFFTTEPEVLNRRSPPGGRPAGWVPGWNPQQSASARSDSEIGSGTSMGDLAALSATGEIPRQGDGDGDEDGAAGQTIERAFPETVPYGYAGAPPAAASEPPPPPADDDIPGAGLAPGASEEEVLKTGMWRTLGASLDADIVVKGGTSLTPHGVRMRRVGKDVEIQALDPRVVIKVDGGISSGGIVSLKDHAVEVDGVPIRDAMVPLDTLDLSELPDFFAPILIGRSPECDYIIDDPAVSGRHAGLSRQQGYLLLEDLDSANGTWVDDRRVKRVRIGWRQAFDIGGRSLTPLDVVKLVRGKRLSGATAVISVLQELDLPAEGAPAQLAAGKAAGKAGGQARSATGGRSGAQLGPDAGRLPTMDVRGETGPAASVDFKSGGTLVVGRDPAADIVLDTPNVSRLHARLERQKDGILVEDLGSTNGTWVNGRRISEATLVKPWDDLRVGPHKLALTEDLKVRKDSVEKGVVGVRLDASKLAREVGPPGKRTLVVDGVSFSILPGEMVAIMGPSGAGKTSVLTTLAGYTPPSSGAVYMDGLSLYDHYDVFRSAIGYVPQEDVMHRTLTVEEVLYYKARLDFPAEVSDEEIRERITAVLRQLDLEHVRGSLVGDETRRGVSGGQRKRLNVAMELMSEPSLLLLDEPTSGLDARSAMQLIRQCRGLASAGRTVAMTIHQPRREAFELFDKLLLLTKGGKLAYFGPAIEARRYFRSRSELPAESAKNPADYALDVLDPLEPTYAREPEHWKKEFRKSPFYERFVRSRLKKEEREHEQRASRRERKAKANPFRQLAVLARRNALLKWRDRTALMVQMAQAPIIAALCVLLFYPARYMPLYVEDDVTPSLFVLVASAVWFGCSNVAREIVGERAVFTRERMGALRVGPYLLSKIGLQAGLIALQVAGLLLLVQVGAAVAQWFVAVIDSEPGAATAPKIPMFQGKLLGLFAVTTLAGWSAMALGMLVSAVARSELQAIQIVPLVVLPQIMLSGILQPVAGDKATWMAKLLSLPILLRWAYSAAQHVELAVGTMRGDKSRGVGGAHYWERSGFGADTLTTDVAVIAGLGLFCALGAWGVLLRRERR
jgi:ABC-type multidrug transport system ATPase subunit